MKTYIQPAMTVIALRAEQLMLNESLLEPYCIRVNYDEDVDYDLEEL